MQRRVHVVVVLGVSLAGLLSVGAQSSCSGSAPLKRAGEPCTRTAECAADLVCTGGVCRAPGDAGASVD